VALNTADRQSLRGLHVAIIMDGNGRWAKGRGLPRLMGHREGVQRLKEVVRACPDLGVQYLTVYAFSTENWRRSRREVTGLMAMFARSIRREARELLKQGVRMRFIGDRSGLSPVLQNLFAWIEELTAGNTRLHMTVAINYGGRDEIMRATRAICTEVAEGRLCPAAVTETLIAEHLDTRGLPDPDLVIRTSGEVRSSNFMPWQTAYSEYEFTPVLWPEFDRAEFERVLHLYGLRERRFGGVTA
jgi:undecaprenyl diphosphate synthase